MAPSARDAAALAGFLVLSYAAAAVGAVGMSDGGGPWYDALEKPSWTPPGSVIGAVWTVLYALIGVSAWLVWRRAGFRGARVAWALFATQLVLNAAWTPTFFEAERLGLAFAVIIALLVAILATIVAFARVSRVAAGLLAPYVAWVAFASYLNWTIWRLNVG